MSPHPHGPLLLTGFEAFDGHAHNPTATTLHELAHLKMHGHRLHTALLPVDAAAAPGVLRQVLDEVQPAAVLLTGLAAGRPHLSLERVALNVADFRIPDNAGTQHQDQPLHPGGPAAYFSTLPLRRILAAWHAQDLPGYLSDTAGLYLCNLVMYEARHRLGEHVPCGFLHVPASPALALAERPGLPRLPYLPQAEITRGIRLALEVVAEGL